MHFYVHIPFCHRVCPYCKFAVSPVVNELTKRRYLEYLKKEINDYFGDGKVKENSVGTGFLPSQEGQEPIKTPISLSQGGINTLYFGGGTPSILSIEELKEILECFWIPFLSREKWNEVTLESNPEDITEEKVKGWIALGVNRISIGVQSLNNKTLETVHRSNVETIFHALKIIQSCILNLKSGISINIDLILGLPYSKSGETLEAIRELHTKFPNITHTSVYILEDEHYPKEWRDHYPSESEVQGEYSEICDYLESKGWHHYEISNWAKPGFESIHNQSYWDHSDYRGFGLSAGSFSGPPLEGGIQGGSFGKRFYNVSNFRDYFVGEKEEEILTQEQLRIEKIMFGLRTFSLDEALIQNKKKLEQFIDEGLLQKKEMILFPTKTGIFMLDYIMSELV